LAQVELTLKLLEREAAAARVAQGARDPFDVHLHERT
jgi:hypothetical protein